jgi:NAD(P)-dependent dehydrogenase (short-subunit alcohol dehydrogenase family)
MEHQLGGRVAVVAGRDEPVAAAVAGALAGAGAELAGTDPRAALRSHGRLDVLVCVVAPPRLVLDTYFAMGDGDMTWRLETGVEAAIAATHAAIGPMAERGRGAIVCIVPPQPPELRGAPAAEWRRITGRLHDVIEALGAEFGPGTRRPGRAGAPAAAGIRVNAISPGAGVEADARRLRTDGIGTRRPATPEEVAALAVLLASDRAAGVSGARFAVGGGPGRSG